MSSTHDLSARTSSAPGSAAATPDAEHSSGQSMLVGAILAVLVVSTLLMVGFIWYRAHGVHEPTTAIYVVGDESLDGTVVTILSEAHDAFITSIKPSNGYTASVLLEPGTYRVIAKHGDQLLLQQDVAVMRFFGPRFDLAAEVKKNIALGRLSPLKPLPPAPTGNP